MIYHAFLDDTTPMSPSGRESFRSDTEQQHSLLQIHDAQSADIRTVRALAREVVRASGAALWVHARTDNADVRAVHDEDPDPTYAPPALLKGVFVPKPLEFELTRWGVDTSTAQEITFCLEDVLARFRERLLRPGDLLQLPYNSQGASKPKYFEITNSQEFGNFRYIWLYLRCQATLLLGDANIRPATDAAEELPDPLGVPVET